MDARTPWDPGDVIDGFLLGRRLARGGMADLFLATPVDGGETVVLKSIREDFLSREEFVRMFEREASLLHLLDHPNIVRARRVRIDRWKSYIVMEFIDGRDLREVVRAAAAVRRRIPISVALKIALDVLSGLESAHTTKRPSGEALEIVHRDVSPSNIMISQAGEVKLLDFGIAKQQLATPTASHLGAKGKASYMAPEQCKGLSIDARVDIYALGAVLYELFTLERPFQGPNDMAILHAILDGDKDDPSSLRLDLPLELEAVVLRALEPDPDDRYPTARAMADALRDAAATADVPIARADEVAALVQLEPPPVQTIEQSLSALKAKGVNHSQIPRSKLESSDQTRIDEDLTDAPTDVPRPSAFRPVLMSALGAGVGAIVLFFAWPAPAPIAVERIPLPAIKAADVAAPPQPEEPEPPADVVPETEPPVAAEPVVEPAPPPTVRAKRARPKKPPAEAPERKSVRLDDDLRPPTL